MFDFIQKKSFEKGSKKKTRQEQSSVNTTSHPPVSHNVQYPHTNNVVGSHSTLGGYPAVQR